MGWVGSEGDGLVWDVRVHDAMSSAVPSNLYSRLAARFVRTSAVVDTGWRVVVSGAQKIAALSRS